MLELTLPGRAGNLSFRVQRRLLGEIVSPREVRTEKGPDELVRAALAAPVGAPPLRELAGPDSRVAVLIDDATRITPTRLILPHVLDALAEAGVPDRNIAIVVALGTHRPMTQAEIEAKVGAEIAGRFTIVNDPAWDEAKFDHLGLSGDGIPAWVHRAVARADLRIGLGMITPHLDAGFSGGSKIVLPGVCGTRTVETFHSRMAWVDENQLALAGARLRLDMEEFVAEAVPLAHIVNVIPDRTGAVYACVAGHPVAAHRAGVPLAMEVFGATVARRYPVVVANAHPCGEDFWQATKALAAAERMAECGGTLILVADCAEGFAEHPRFPEYSALEPGDIRNLLDRGRADDPVAAGEAVALSRIRAHFSLSVVSRSLPALPERFGAARFDTVEAAVADAVGRLHGPTDGCLAVLTHGGFTAPFAADPDQKLNIDPTA